jgi:tRNA-specific 2-thiouridylase
MSGGVDSSVAAALLQEAGHEVIGVTMELYSLPPEYCREPGHVSCCGRESAFQAQEVAKRLGIEFYLIDVRKEFERDVVQDFCRSYAEGRTPNPCIRCNEFIKFRALGERADRLGASGIATGHYARVIRDPNSGRYWLKKGRDLLKDQSYFLYGLTQAQLTRARFPLGGMTKTQVRRQALSRGLPVAERPESQEICFIPDNDYSGFLSRRAPELFRPGPIVDTEGTVLGTHSGIIHFTIGQRRGIGLSAPHPLYVLEIRAQDQAIVVGRNQELDKTTILAGDLNWIAFDPPVRPLKASARIRYKHREASATVVPVPGAKVTVEFERPQRAVTPGQSVVFYDEDVVLGGGIIEAALDGKRHGSTKWK